MNHHVFISHSSLDNKIANAICHYLEDAGIRCWLAPRDIDTTDWAGSIMKGIHTCDVFVVIISQNSIPSPEVIKEVTEATRVCRYILPFKVDDEMLSDRLRYHLGPCHWTDAMTKPLEQHIEKLKHRILNLSDEDSVYLNASCQQLTSNISLPKNFFVGREEEMAQIHEMLQEDHVLFLQGMGGIGKSEIAKAYAKTYADDYKTIIFANYRESILDLVIGDDIPISNLNRNTSYGEDAEPAEVFFKRKLKTLKELSTSKTLIIVDNFDVLDDENLQLFTDGPYKLLFTTRYEHFDYAFLPVGPIQDFEKVRQIFTKNYGRPLPPKDKPVIDEILNLVNCHTITVELIAKQMRASFLPPAKMLEILKKDGTNTHLKDEVVRGAKKTAFDFIKDLFQLSDLTEDEQYLLKCMCLVPFSGIEVSFLGDILELESYDVINELTAKSWLMLDEETYYLKIHPIIADVVKDQLQPDQTSCSKYIVGLWNHVRGAWNMTLEERNKNWPYVDHIQKYYGTPTKELFPQYSSFANIAWICGQFKQSIAASTKLYEFTLKNYGDIGFQAAVAARCVAGSYSNGGDEAGAEPYFRLALDHLLKAVNEYDVIDAAACKQLGPVCKELGIVYNRLVPYEYKRGNFETAKYYVDESFKWHDRVDPDFENIGDPNGNCIANTYVKYARLCIAMKDYEKALELSQTAYDRYFAFLNKEITSSAYTLSDMGICYSHLGEYEKAEEYLDRALNLNNLLNGEASVETLHTKESIADNLARQGRIDEAKKMYLQMELETEKNFGECPLVMQFRKKQEQL